MDFNQALQLKNDLDEQCKIISKRNHEKYDQFRINNGLIPDHIKFSHEYQSDKKEYDIAFNKLRNYNEWFLREFKREYNQYIKNSKVK